MKVIIRIQFYCVCFYCASGRLLFNHSVLIQVARSGGGMSLVGQEVAALSMIGECRWVLQPFPYRHWTSSTPLKSRCRCCVSSHFLHTTTVLQASGRRYEGGAQDEVHFVFFFPP